MANKIRVAVLYGGKSGEHEVSLLSGAAVIRHLDREKFEVIPVSIDKTGRWQWNDLKLIEASQSKSLPISRQAPEMRLAPQNDGRAALEPLDKTSPRFADIDVFFPVMHGPLCEDGTIQGLLELADVAYVGSGVLGSAVSMDKDIAKRLAQVAGVPVAPYLAFQHTDFAKNPDAWLRQLKEKLQLPVFVKPANMGSSVGIHKVKRWEDLPAALQDAFQYDTKLLVEQGVDAREIEVAVLEEDPLLVSLPSEVITSPKHEFYSYDAKYLDQEGAHMDLPAHLSEAETRQVQDLAALTFRALECSGLARVDFFLDRRSGKFLFNEVNTLPGFTPISMYPKMMEASGVPYSQLLTRLVEIALAKHEAKHRLKRDFS